MLAGHLEILGLLWRSYLVYQLILAQFVHLVHIKGACVVFIHLEQQLTIIFIVREEAGKALVLDFYPSAVDRSPVLLPGGLCAGGAVAYGYPLGLNGIAALIEPAYRKGFGHRLIIARFHLQFDGVVCSYGGWFTVYRGLFRVVRGPDKLSEGFAIGVISKVIGEHIPHGTVGIAAICPSLSIEFHPVICRGSVGKLYALAGEGDVYIESDPVEMIIAFIILPLYQHAFPTGLGRDYNIIPIIPYPRDFQTDAEGVFFIIHVFHILKEFQTIIVRGVGIIQGLKIFLFTVWQSETRRQIYAVVLAAIIEGFFPILSGKASVIQRNGGDRVGTVNGNCFLAALGLAQCDLATESGKFLFPLRRGEAHAAHDHYQGQGQRK